MTSLPWPSERDAVLIALRSSGLSFAQITREIGARFNITLSRDACVGRARRLGLCGRGRSGAAPCRAVRARPKRRPVGYGDPSRAAPASAAAREVALRCAEVVPRHLSLADLAPDDCRFPYGEDAITFCGHRQTKGSSYCLAHFHLSRKLHPEVAR